MSESRCCMHGGPCFYRGWTEAEKGAPMVETPDGHFALMDSDDEAKKVAERLNQGVRKGLREAAKRLAHAD